MSDTNNNDPLQGIFEETAKTRPFNKRPPIGHADKDLVIDPSHRANWLVRFLVSQSGGYDPKYYTNDEAKHVTYLAGAKFVSVSLATYAFMKAVNPDFGVPSFQSLPAINNIDPKYLLVTTAAGALWWGLSKLDTSVMHGIRSQKAARFAATQFKIDNPEAQRSKWQSILFRFGISAGSLGITLPALWIAMSEGTVDEYNRKNTVLINAPIIAEYQGKLDVLDEQIRVISERKIALENSLLELQAPGQSLITPAQEELLATLSAKVKALQDQKTQEERKLIEEQRVRDAAESRIVQETKGLRGSEAGCAVLCETAMADRDDAIRRMETINVTIGLINESIEETTKQINGINEEVSRVTEASKNEIAEQVQAIQNQITTLTQNLSDMNQAREAIKDVAGLAKADARYKDYDADLSEKVDAYIDYMKNEANLIELGYAAFIALMIASMELGVFALAAGRNTSPGEVRGYLAEFIKSKEAGDVFKKSILLQDLNEEISTDAETIALLKRRKISEQDAEIFAEALKKVSADPVLRERVLNDVMGVFEKLRVVANKAKIAETAETADADHSPKGPDRNQGPV